MTILFYIFQSAISRLPCKGVYLNGDPDPLHFAHVYKVFPLLALEAQGERRSSVHIFAAMAIERGRVASHMLASLDPGKAGIHFTGG